MPGNEEQDLWFGQPKWDAQNGGWCWEGQRLEGTGQFKPIKKWLLPDEFGPDGYPLALQNNANPISPMQQPLMSTPQSGNFGTSGSSLDQVLADYPSSKEHSGLPGLYPQHFSNYQSHDGSLNQERPHISTDNRRRRQRPSEKNPVYAQEAAQFGASFQAASSQPEFQDIQSFIDPASNTNGCDGNQVNGVNFLSPASTWTPGSGNSVSQSFPERAPPSFELTSSYESKDLPAAYVNYGAQGHPHARWAGGPSNGDVGLSPIRVRQNALNKIKLVPGKDVLLDSNFDVYPSSSFQPGKIIKVWWSEPAGMPTRGAFGSRLSRPDTLLREHKKAIWTGFRRFIIIRNFEGHCHGIPIYSYGGQGCNKHGVKHSEHGAIYEDLPGSTGALLPNEKPLAFPSIRAKTTNGEPMNNASRVNYAKVADIGHNLKVNFIAEVVAEDWDVAKDALKKSGFC